MTLVVGRRYLCGMGGLGICSIVYLGPVPGLKSYCRVRSAFSRKVHLVKVEALKPLLVSVAGGASNVDEVER